MKEITDLQSIQALELKALTHIDSFCKKHGLRYFLAGGTLLGAVRHKGFIPWDNDVDIALPRKDYETFIRLAEMEAAQGESPYRIARITDDNDYFYGFAKLYDSRTLLREDVLSTPLDWLGVYIDLFPIDGFGDNMDQAKNLMHRAVHTLHRIVRSKSKEKAVTLRDKCARLHHYLRYALFGRGRSMARLSRRLQQYDFDHSALIASTWGVRGEKEILPQALFAQSCQVEFEGLSLPAPIGWDEYLTAMYGDYMQLPPEEKRIPPHAVTVYIKNGEKI